MNLDNRGVYAEVKYKLSGMRISELKELISTLYTSVYINNDPEQKEYHRLASYVYQQRLKFSC